MTSLGLSQAVSSGTGYLRHQAVVHFLNLFTAFKVGFMSLSRMSKIEGRDAFPVSY